MADGAQEPEVKQGSPGAVVLMTGASGQMGAIVREALRSAGRTLICATGSSRPLSERDVRWIPWSYEDSLQPPTIEEPVEALIYLGAQTSAQVARRSPRNDLLTNGVRFVALLEGLVAAGHRPFVVLAGTATQAGPQQSHIDAGTLNAPQTFYDVSKSVCESYLDQFIREGWVSGVTLKFSNVYGAGPGPVADRSVLSQAMRKALRGEAIEMFAGCDGHRDYLHVRDAAGAVLAALDGRESLSHTSYWVGSGESLRVSEALSVVIQVAQGLTGMRSKVRHVPAPSHLYTIDRRDVHVDASLFRSDASWYPRVSFTKGAHEMGLALAFSEGC